MTLHSKKCQRTPPMPDFLDIWWDGTNQVTLYNILEALVYWKRQPETVRSRGPAPRTLRLKAAQNHISTNRQDAAPCRARFFCNGKDRPTQFRSCISQSEVFNTCPWRMPEGGMPRSHQNPLRESETAVLILKQSHQVWCSNKLNDSGLPSITKSGRETWKLS